VTPGELEIHKFVYLTPTQTRYLEIMYLQTLNKKELDFHILCKHFGGKNAIVLMRILYK